MAALHKEQERGKVLCVLHNKAARLCQRGVGKHEGKNGENPRLDHESFLCWWMTG